MRILLHTLDTNSHFEFVRRFIDANCGSQHEVIHLITKEDGNAPMAFNRHSPLDRYKREKKLFLIAKKRNQALQYLKNRALLVFFSKYKKRYDQLKIGYIRAFFDRKNKELDPVPAERVVHIQDINQEEKRICDIDPDIMIIVGAPFIRKNILNAVKRKFNLHIGYLPDYRGLNCPEWAYWEGEYDKIGYSIHQLTEELDGGGIIKRQAAKIDPRQCHFGKIYSDLYVAAFADLAQLINTAEWTELHDSSSRPIYNSYLVNPLRYKKLIRMMESLEKNSAFVPRLDAIR